MPNQNQVAQINRITECVEQLLLRHQELLRANAQLGEQVSALTVERDSLRSRLSAARARVDSLIERLPDTTDPIANTPVDSAR
jgi:cell division protein ZapB